MTNIAEILAETPDFDLKDAKCKVLKNGDMTITIKIRPKGDDVRSRQLIPLFANLPEVVQWGKLQAAEIIRKAFT